MKAAVLWVSLAWIGLVRAAEWSGFFAVEGLQFFEDPAFPGQHSSYLSLVGQPEWYHEIDAGSQSFRFVPFGRIDQYDDRRTHWDIRELSWTLVADRWESTVGISKVYWGVTEAVHLVDIINQTDLVENLDGEDKLGQPMIKLSLVRQAGTLDLFVLPGFRERTFPGPEGRPRLPLDIDVETPLYESAAGERHVDFAVRWFQFLGAWEIGLSHFRGTTREPRFVVMPGAGGRPDRIRLLYEVIDQTGLELQGAYGSNLWKLEAINRFGQGERFAALDAGFEYTLVGVGDTAIDVGVLGEYLWDERGDDAIGGFQNDLLVGARLTFNDVQSTQLLAGLIFDLEGGGNRYNLEASRRLGDQWLLSLEARGVFGTTPKDIWTGFMKKDHSIRLELAFYL